MSKNWEEVLREIPTPPDSDAEDGPNIVKVQKNARMISDALHHLVPVLNPSLASSLPRGLNSSQKFRDSFQNVGGTPSPGEKKEEPCEKKQQE